MRPRIVAGNWKMNTNRATARALAGAVAQGVVGVERSEGGVEVAVCPPFPYLLPVAEVLAGTPVVLGAQDCYEKDKGAFTGEVSPTMLADVGCRYVILGHSERRHILGESDALVAAKVRAALQAGLRVILCVGETLAERDAGIHEGVFDRQARSALSDLGAADLARVVIAYEPVWAIGTGRTATPAQAQEAHAFLRRRITEIHREKAGIDLPVLYGGSVKSDNAAELFSQPDVDGGLIGGASLEADQFLAIVRAAQR
jgi:triosephosphate isomerase